MSRVRNKVREGRDMSKGKKEAETETVLRGDGRLGIILEVGRHRGKRPSRGRVGEVIGLEVG